ncbi:MarR family winged helix-turn-helix transcriptional regulator [Nesterenkonia haasae]|uniref:MarR family winged helix-turn-helix transcriptional regulator n=1 Tax=Nesterenkonia haasae TaxID=2587813 RepID=UPI001390B120|nr:MarR family transcriptional regulator [Nesterenkonia haasae]NDK32530.1 MarR family transcriptional regulator [Nesterenkonia haasae]
MGRETLPSPQGSPPSDESAPSVVELLVLPPSEDSPGSGYWYTRNPDSLASVDLLSLLRKYRAAERAMRARIRKSMDMGETDLAALTFLVRQRSAGKTCRQRDLAHALNMTAASTSVLVDRLSREGYLRRIPHPEDRRSVGLEVLEETDRAVKATLGGLHTRMIHAAESLTDAERAGAAKFLSGLIHSVRGDADQ